MNTDVEHERPASIQVTFSYWGLETERGPSERTMEVRAGTTVGELLDRMSLTLRHDLRAETAREGTRFVSLDGRYCALPDSLARELTDGDDLRLLPFVAGG
jgi:sulfur carrier protein ThiS